MHRYRRPAALVSRAAHQPPSLRGDSFPIIITAITRGSVQQGLSAVQTHDR